MNHFTQTKSFIYVVKLTLFSSGGTCSSHIRSIAAGNKMQHEEIRLLQFNTLVLKRVNAIKLTNTSNWIIKLSPTYSHRKKALKFFILLSITLHVQIKVAIWQNKKGHMQKLLVCFFTNLLQKFIGFERERAHSCDGTCTQHKRVFTNTKKTDLFLFMTVTLKGLSRYEKVYHQLHLNPNQDAQTFASIKTFLSPR